MRGAVARGEVDTSAMRAKVTSLEAMKARFAAEPGFAFPADGTRVPDPSGRWDCRMDDGGSLEVGNAGAADLNWGSLDVGGATCVFADGGSTLCVRRADEWRITYETYDIERRISLQEFHEDTGKPRPQT